MVEKLDHLMAVEDYKRQSLLVSVLNLFLEQLARYRRSNDSMDALAILECYVECSLEENAEHAHSPRDIQKLIKHIQEDCYKIATLYVLYCNGSNRGTSGRTGLGPKRALVRDGAARLPRM